MDIVHPPGPPLLPSPIMDGPPMPPQIPHPPGPPHWMDNPLPPWANPPPDMPFDDNPYLNDDDRNNFENNFSDFRMNRGGHNNFRGLFNDNFQFRGRGWGRGPGGRGNNRGGWGNPRGARGGGGQFRPRGNFRGGFNRGGF